MWDSRSGRGSASPPRLGSPSARGPEPMTQGRSLLIATAVIGIFLWLLQASEDSTRLSFAPGWIAAAVGLACTAYIVYRLVSPPQDNYDPALGLYLGLVSAAGVAIGGLLS